MTFTLIYTFTVSSFIVLITINQLPVDQIWVVFKQLGEPGKVSVRTTGEGKPGLDLEPFLQCNVATTQCKFNVATLWQHFLQYGSSWTHPTLPWSEVGVLRGLHPWDIPSERQFYGKIYQVIQCTFWNVIVYYTAPTRARMAVTLGLPPSRMSSYAFSYLPSSQIQL